MNKVLITGASGFVGKNLIDYLQQKHVDTLPYSRSEGRDYALVDPTFLDHQQISAIVHLAGKAHDLRRVVNSEAYYAANTDLTRHLFDAFLQSNASVFIYISSIKALADRTDVPLTEEMKPVPLTDYGKSKLAAEVYLQQQILPPGKKLYILRPCMIHGSGNKGNLNLLYKLVTKGMPWPLGSFANKRSVCSIDNLIFIINELLSKNDISSGLYNIADDDFIDTNEIIRIIAQSLNRKPKIWKIDKSLIRLMARIGDIFWLPLNSERLDKLTENFIVSNNKIKSAIRKPLPLTTREGLINTFNKFKNAN